MSSMPALHQPAPPAGANERTRVLLLDDDPMWRLLAGHALRERGFEVIACETAHEALDEFDRSAPACVITDLLMPGVDGLEFCRRLRRRPQGRAVPVLMLTSVDEGDATASACDAGASDYCVKSSNWTLLTHRIGQLLRPGAPAPERRGAAGVYPLAHFDPKTGLPNRAWLMDRLTRGAEPGSPQAPSQQGLVVVDIDRFRHVDEALGPAASDRLLACVGRRLRGVEGPCRPVRVESVVYLGADGFALLLTGLPDASVLLQVAQRVLACLRDPFVVGEREVFIRCSVGAAAAARGAPPDATLLTQADLARREANAAGGNAARLYDAARVQHGFDRLQIEHDLHHALARRELNVFYQPQVDARTRELVGFEALMRWQRAGTMQPAARFIEIAEDTGLIVPMGEWAIGEACAALAAMRAVGLSRCLMSINLSCQQLRNARLPGVVTDAAGRHGLTCADIEVELTESGIMRDADNALQALAQLRSHGAGVAVDDFGTGYSSLSYLTRLPLTTLKIDRSFVRDVHRSRQSCAVARAIVSMGGHLGLRVIAEGVETEAQRAALIELGCPLQQGYLHGHAVALDEALRWAEPSAGGNR